MSNSYIYYIGEECPRDLYIIVGDDFCKNRCRYNHREFDPNNQKIIYCKYRHEESCE